MNAIRTFSAFCISAFFASSVLGQAFQPYSLTIFEEGFTDDKKTGVHIIMPTYVPEASNKRCHSNEPLNKITYKFIAIKGALTDTQHLQAAKITVKKINDTRFKLHPEWDEPLKLYSPLKKNSISDLNYIKNSGCDTFILDDEDYKIAKEVITKLNNSNTTGGKFYFEKSLTFDEAMISWARYLGYRDPEVYVNSFMKIRHKTNIYGYERYSKIGLTNPETVKQAIDRANSAQYPLGRNGSLILESLFNFIMDEQRAQTSGKSIATLIKENEVNERGAEAFRRSPHVLRCGLNVDCGSAQDLSMKMADAVNKLAEASKPNGSYKFRDPLSSTQASSDLKKCNSAYQRAHALISAHPGDVYSHAERLIAECSGPLSKLSY